MEEGRLDCGMQQQRRRRPRMEDIRLERTERHPAQDHLADGQQKPTLLLPPTSAGTHFPTDGHHCGTPGGGHELSVAADRSGRCIRPRGKFKSHRQWMGPAIDVAVPPQQSALSRRSGHGSGLGLRSSRTGLSLLT